LTGQRLGPYEVLDKLGEGGMGEVYRARDTKLHRDVAIKTLPASFASDPERLARFEREAQVLAALNHPNIAHIHGLEEVPEGERSAAYSGFGRGIVMELVDGDDLSAIIARGPMPLADAIPVARQIADALEAAHEQGIVHRDLKPANVKVRADGFVKVLDFGLAKALDATPSSSTDAMNSPTLTVRATQMGLIVGTAAYMAPEQARGKAVDRRADIWAFGVVLYEMLSGERAFKGEDVSVTLASVIKDDANWRALPPDLPIAMHTLLRRCLEKDPRRRLRDIGEARLMLEDPALLAPATTEPAADAKSTAPQSAPLWRRALPIAATAIVVAATTGLLTWRLWPPPAATPIVTRFSIVLPDDQQIARPNMRAIAVSPDGSRIVYAANRQLYQRSMTETEARPIPGTDLDVGTPFFSPDGQWVGFYTFGSALLRKIPIAGGTPQTICKTDTIRGAHWDGDTIVFGSAAGGIMRVSANGGDPEIIAKVDGSEVATDPQLLDEGRLLLFTLANDTARDRWDTAQVIVQSTSSGQRHLAVRGGSAARFLSTGPSSASGGERDDGHIVYAVGNSLTAVPYNISRLEVTGPPAPVLEPVARAATVAGALATGVAQYAVSRTGMLAYLAGTARPITAPKALALAGRDGKIKPIRLPPQPYAHPRVSPDGRQLVVEIDDGKEANLWVFDLEGGSALRRLTFGGPNRYPVWTRDGRFITFQSEREGDSGVFRQPADGSGPAERLTRPEAGIQHQPESWSPDGKTLSMNLVRGGNQSVWTTGVEGDAKPRAFADSVDVEKHSAFSPDGRWIAYMSTFGRGLDVFIEPFPPTGAKYQVSEGGGRAPVWSRDGKQLIYHATTTNRLVVVDVRSGPGLTFGAPAPIPLDGTIHPLAQRNYDVTPDGSQFVVVLPVETTPSEPTRPAATQFNIVLNWTEELKQRVPAR
jgi:serine/threonine-protein kinase